MQSESETTSIDGINFEMRYLDPQSSADLLCELAKVVAPPIARLVEAQKTSADNGSHRAGEDPDVGLTEASTLFFQSLDVALLRKVAGAFADVTLVDGAPLSRVLSQVFRGRIDLYFKWLWWGSKVQWGKCFGALLGAVDGLPAVATVAQRFSSQSTSVAGGG